MLIHINSKIEKPFRIFRRPHRPRRPLRRLRRSGSTALLRCRRLQGALQPRGPGGHHRALPGSRLHLSAPGAVRSPHGPKAELGPRMVEISDANLRMEVGGNLVAKRQWVEHPPVVRCQIARAAYFL